MLFCLNAAVLCGARPSSFPPAAHASEGTVRLAAAGTPPPTASSGPAPSWLVIELFGGVVFASRFVTSPSALGIAPLVSGRVALWVPFGVAVLVSLRVPRSVPLRIADFVEFWRASPL